MPFKSEAQRRKFHALEAAGKMSAGTVAQWEAETGDARLPERVGSASATPATTRLPRGGGSRYARAHRARLY